MMVVVERPRRLCFEVVVVIVFVVVIVGISREQNLACGTSAAHGGGPEAVEVASHQLVLAGQCEKGVPPRGVAS